MRNKRNPKGPELKKEILKKLGLKSSDISVRYDGSYNIYVKNINVSCDAVEAIAKSRQKIDYDHASGEILCGGNTFVFVNYDYKLAPTAEMIKQIVDVRNSITFGLGIPLDAMLYHVCKTLEEKNPKYTKYTAGDWGFFVSMLPRETWQELFSNDEKKAA